MIITNNEEALRVVCSDATSEEISAIVSQLDLELKQSAKLGRPGIGLAAPQIGIAKNVAIVRLDSFNIDLVNPTISSLYDPFVFQQEGCLSFPGRVEVTNRYQEAVIKNSVYPNNIIVTGLLAVVCQHEIDHLNQKLLIDFKKQHVKTKIKPNDLCFCNSGKKYKKCCLGK
jgi:peptide deformylase